MPTSRSRKQRRLAALHSHDKRRSREERDRQNRQIRIASSLNLKPDEMAFYDRDTHTVEVVKLSGRAGKLEKTRICASPTLATVEGVEAGSKAEKTIREYRMRNGLPVYSHDGTDIFF